MLKKAILPHFSGGRKLNAENWKFCSLEKKDFAGPAPKKNILRAKKWGRSGDKDSSGRSGEREEEKRAGEKVGRGARRA